MTARGAAGRCPPTSQTWLGARLLLLCLLVSRSLTEEESNHCSNMIGDGHLQHLQQLIDSQMETPCNITFQFVSEVQLEDPVCYIQKAFFLVPNIIYDTISFKDNTSNAIALVKLQELSVRLNACFPEVSEKQGKACVQNFSEQPLKMLEKIKHFFSETKNLLKRDQNIFIRNCDDSFAKCSSPGEQQRGQETKRVFSETKNALKTDPNISSSNCNDSFAKCSSPDVVTKPDCNCLSPKATPSRDLASVSPQQPPAPSMAPLAGLTRADSEGTEDSSLLPSEQLLHTADLGSAKQRPPRSTCQSFESAVTPGAKGDPSGGSPEPHPSEGAPVSGMKDVLDSVLGANWALEEASGEASEAPVPRGPEPPSSRLGGGSVQVEATRPSDLISASPGLPGLAKGQLPADGTGTFLPKVGPVRPTGQVRSHTPEKTEHPSVPGSARTLFLRPRGLSRPATLSAQARLPGSRAWGSVRPLGELPVKRSTRGRRSTAGLDGGPASEGAAVPQAHFNSVPLTDAGQAPQFSKPPLPVPSIAIAILAILVLLAVGGLLFYRWRRRSQRVLQMVGSPVERPEASPLTREEYRRAEMPV